MSFKKYLGIIGEYLKGFGIFAGIGNLQTFIKSIIKKFPRILYSIIINR